MEWVSPFPANVGVIVLETLSDGHTYWRARGPVLRLWSVAIKERDQGSCHSFLSTFSATAVQLWYLRHHCYVRNLEMQVFAS